MRSLRGLHWLTLLLAALSLTMESAHVLELPQKLQYDPTMYAAVNGTLYRYFAIVGGAYQVGAILAAFGLVIALRGRPRAQRWTVAGAVCLALAFGIWLAVVEPVNLAIARATRDAPRAVPMLWTERRMRWEGGHAAGFVAQLLGFGALAWSALLDTVPPSRS